MAQPDSITRLRLWDVSRPVNNSTIPHKAIAWGTLDFQMSLCKQVISKVRRKGCISWKSQWDFVCSDFFHAMPWLQAWGCHRTRQKETQVKSTGKHQHAPSRMVKMEIQNMLSGAGMGGRSSHTLKNCWAARSKCRLCDSAFPHPCRPNRNDYAGPTKNQVTQQQCHYSTAFGPNPGIKKMEQNSKVEFLKYGIFMAESL